METYQIITTILSSLSILGVGTVLTTLWKENHNKRLKKKEEQSQEHINALKTKNTEEIKQVLQEELKPVIVSVNSMQTQLTNVGKSLKENSEGTVTLLRDRMQCSLEFCKRRGYVTEDDLFNWNQLYERYTKMGGNFFHKYVDIWKKEIEALPIKEKSDE